MVWDHEVVRAGLTTPIFFEVQITSSPPPSASMVLMLQAMMAVFLFGNFWGRFDFDRYMHHQMQYDKRTSVVKVVQKAKSQRVRLCTGGLGLD